MSRSTVLLVLAVAAAAVSADEYAFNQFDEILARVGVCLKTVPYDRSSFNNPASDCTWGARWSLDDGNSKESLPDSIASCLVDQNVDAAIVATVQQCLNDSLAVDLPPAMEEAGYSGSQILEIGGRIQDCLEPLIPETRNYTPGSECRLDAILRADEGYPKEALVNFVAPCLTQKGIDAAVVDAASACITPALAEPLSSSD